MSVLIFIGCAIFVTLVYAVIHLVFQYKDMQSALQEVYDNLGPEATNCGCMGCEYETNAAIKAVLPFVNQHYKKR
jgi:hypothetical protein